MGKPGTYRSSLGASDGEPVSTVVLLRRGISEELSGRFSAVSEPRPRHSGILAGAGVFEPRDSELEYHGNRTLSPIREICPPPFHSNS